MLLAEVAVPVPLGRAFSYQVPAELASRVVPGARVLCEFGRRRMLAVVLDVAEREPPIDPARIKAIAAVLDARPVLEPELLAFLQELAAYYFAPIGEVLRLALPAVERTQARELEAQGLFDEKAIKKVVGGRRELFVRARPDASTDARLRGHAVEILEHLRGRDEASVAELRARWKNAREVVKRLAALSLVETFEREKPADPFFAKAEPRDVPPTLTEAQAIAAEALAQSIQDRKAATYLLHGVTGSGKTEVYLRAIAACLEARRGALVLVPEIALTPQLVGRFRARFGDELAVLHSGLGDRERHEMWKRLREGRVHVAIGARSAIFAPVPELGLVIVDEEHDPSFKQEEGVRYHARDMAILRGHRAGATVVLGSATPSLETEALARRGKARRLSLPERAHASAALPKVELVDLKRYLKGPSGQIYLSTPLHRALERTLDAGEQAILFLNRRGFAPSVLCNGCGIVLSCHGCAVALTYHQARGGRLRCHYCDWEGPLPSTCPECRLSTLALEGLGTEKLEAAVAEAFPEARVARLDRDVASGAKAEAILERMRAGAIDVLIGTQMVTKGHDLPRVTLVGVVNADAALSVPDHRAAERAFQLLVQVAGRAGRGDLPGTVVVQSRDPGHPAIRFAMRHDVAGFVEHELREREELSYPPFVRLALIRIEAIDLALAKREAERIASAIRETDPVQTGRVQVLGPAEAPIAKLRSRHRWQLLVRGSERRFLRRALAPAIALRERVDRRVHVIIDIDPVQMM